MKTFLQKEKEKKKRKKRTKRKVVLCPIAAKQVLNFTIYAVSYFYSPRFWYNLICSFSPTVKDVSQAYLFILDETIWKAIQNLTSRQLQRVIILRGLNLCRLLSNLILLLTFFGSRGEKGWNFFCRFGFVCFTLEYKLHAKT